MATTRNTTRKTTGTATATATATVPAKEVRKFNNNDLIPCKSVTSGELLMVGAKTGILYKWASCDDIEDIEYQDLLYATRQRSSYVMKPYFIVLDDDFVSQNKELDKLYRGMYSFTLINDILQLEPNAMRQVILSLPAGVQEAVKGVAATKINDGSFDSIKKIKVLDEIFGTSMLQILVDNE